MKMTKILALLAGAAVGAGLGPARADLWLNNNLSFENGLTNWTVYYAPPITTSTNYAMIGTHSLEIPTAGTSFDPQDLVDFATIQPNQSYTGSVFYLVPTLQGNNERFAVGMGFYKWDEPSSDWVQTGSWQWGDIIFGPLLPDYPTGMETTGAWTKISVAATAPADAQLVQFDIQARGNGSTYYFDNVQFIPEPLTGGMLLGATGVLIYLRRKLRRC